MKGHIDHIDVYLLVYIFIIVESGQVSGHTVDMMEKSGFG